MIGVFIRIWDPLHSGGRELSVVVPLEMSLEAAVKLLSEGILPSLAEKSDVEHTRKVVTKILAGTYSYTLKQETVDGDDGNLSSDKVFHNNDDDVDDDVEQGVEPGYRSKVSTNKVVDLVKTDFIKVETSESTLDEKCDLTKEDSLEAVLIQQESDHSALVEEDEEEAEVRMERKRQKRRKKHLAKAKIQLSDDHESLPKRSKRQIHKCDVNCGQEFKSKILLQKHQRRLHGDLYCYKCKRAYLAATHVCQLPYKCDECGSGFADRFMLRRHTLIHYGRTPHVCETCGRNYTSKAVLMKHNMIHTGEKPHVCDTCGKKFRQRGSLKIHQRTHKSRQSFPCDLCDATFINQESLQHHKMVHTGEVAHICDICSQTFSTRSNLGSHVKRFHGRREIFCPVCNKGFSFNHELKKHMGKHTETRSHVCDQCSASFYNRDYLVKHQRAVHGEKKYFCHICKSAYSTQFYLNRHMGSHKEEGGMKSASKPRVHKIHQSHQIQEDWDDKIQLLPLNIENSHPGQAPSGT